MSDDEALDAVALARPLHRGGGLVGAGSPEEHPLGLGRGAGPCAWCQLGSPLQVYMECTWSIHGLGWH